MLARAATRPLERLLPAAAAAASGAACTPPMAAATSPAAWLTCQRPYAHDASSAGSNAPEGGAQQGGSSPAAAAAAHGGGSSASSGTAAPGGSGSFAASAYGEHSMHDHYDYQQQHGYELSEEEEEEAARRRHARAAADPAFRHQRERLMDAALRHVPTLGWAGGAAAAAAAAELGLSPAAAGMLGSDAELVQAFVQRCNQRLEAELRELSAAGKMQGLDTRCATGAAGFACPSACLRFAALAVKPAGCLAAPWCGLHGCKPCWGARPCSRASLAPCAPAASACAWAWCCGCAWWSRTCQTGRRRWPCWHR